MRGEREFLGRSFLEKSCSNQVYESLYKDTPTKTKRKLRFISVFPTDIEKKNLLFFIYFQEDLSSLGYVSFAT